MFSCSDGISNEDPNEEDEDVWEDQEDSRTTSVKFTDDVQNERAKEVRIDRRVRFQREEKNYESRKNTWHVSGSPKMDG